MPTPKKKKPSPTPTPDPDRPWDDPIFRKKVEPHKVIGAPTTTTESIADKPMRDAEGIKGLWEKAKRLIPEELWNTPKQKKKKKPTADEQAEALK